MVPAELHDICFNCLSYSHRVATCWLSRRCLCCHDFRHLARDYKRPRHTVALAAKDRGRPWHPARDGNPTTPRTRPTAAQVGVSRGALAEDSGDARVN
jgi:hypothetical protein